MLLNDRNSVRVTEELTDRMRELVLADPERYRSVSMVVRVAVIRLLRQEKDVLKDFRQCQSALVSSKKNINTSLTKKRMVKKQ